LPIIRAALFDLDGVLVDTAKYHYLAWKRLADELGFTFSPEHNERLKGVSRMRSLEILLEVGNLGGLPADERETLAAKKNAWYVQMLGTLTQADVLPGARETLQSLRARGIRTALGSASKNAPLILEKLGIAPLLDAIVDGNSAHRAKPDPQVFTLGAQALGLPAAACAVFEDAVAGIEAAHRGGMVAVGVGAAEKLPQADYHVPGLYALDIDAMLAHFAAGEGRTQ
jgi:beta-phosphoglucomutase